MPSSRTCTGGSGKSCPAGSRPTAGGKGTVGELSTYVQRRQPGIRGFSPQNLWRMRQFVEAWQDGPKLSALLRELPWTQHVIILGQSKRPEEQEFYL